MKKLFTILTALLIVSSLSAQERYLDEIFDEVNVATDIQYGQNYSYYQTSDGASVFQELYADVYTPVGDTETERPLVIMMHAGSFLPGGSVLPFGDNKDPHVQEICEQFAKRGWTAAAITYRLGWNPFGSAEVRAGTIMSAVYRATLDLKTAVRYFRKTVAEEGNPYGIDPNKVVGAGTNSGGFCVVTAASLDREEELYLDKFLGGDFLPLVNTDLLGTFDGSGGTEGINNYQWSDYNGEIDMALNLGGAIGDISWIEAGEVPIVSAHGVIEELTPYDTGIVVVSLTGDPVVEVMGSKDIAVRINELGNNDKFKGLTDAYTQSAEANFAVEEGEGEGCFLFRNKGFEPWGYYNCEYSAAVSDDDDSTEFCSSNLQNELVNGAIENYITNENLATPYIDTIMNYFAPRAVIQLELDGFEDLIVETPSSSNILSANGQFDIFPNPTKNLVNIESFDNTPIKSVILTSINGQVVKSFDSIAQKDFTFDVADLSTGIYFMTIENDKKSYIQKLMVE